ncbi:hypothetical protein D3C81_815690 [compost metagenome]
MGPLHHHGGQLHDGHQGAVADDGAGHQGAHGHLVLRHEPGAHGDQRHVGQLLEGGRDVLRQGRIVADILLGIAGLGHQFGPARLHHPFGAAALEGFDAVDGFHQQAGLAVAGIEVLARVALDGALEHQAAHQGQGQGHQRHHHQPAADDGDHGQEDQGERHVGEHEQGRRGKHAAHHLEALHLRRQGADGGRACFHADAQHALEKPLGQFMVDVIARMVDDAAAHLLEDEFQADRQGHAHHQHPQGAEALVGDHAVVHLHGKQRGGHGQQGYQRGGQHGVDKHAFLQPQGIAHQAKGAGTRRAFLAAARQAHAGQAGQRRQQQGAAIGAFAMPGAVGAARLQQAPARAGAVDGKRQFARRRLVQQARRAFQPGRLPDGGQHHAWRAVVVDVIELALQVGQAGGGQVLAREPRGPVDECQQAVFDGGVHAVSRLDSVAVSWRAPMPRAPCVRPECPSARPGAGWRRWLARACLPARTAPGWLRARR